MIVARRVYLYGIAFATVWMLVNGLAGLLEVALEAVAQAVVGPVAIVPGSGLADMVSFYGALTGIGLVTWIIHWGLVVRGVGRDPVAETRSAIRKLYLYGVLLIGGLILIFEFRQVLIDLLGLAFGTVSGSDVANGEVLEPLSMLAATGAFWAYHLRVVHRDRAAVPETGAAATIRRWCVYGLSFVGLMLLLFGMSGLLSRLIELSVPRDGNAIDSGRWLALDISGRAASVVAGLIAWVSAWGGSTRQFANLAGPDRERDSVLRKVYLYGVLLIAVTWTVWSVALTLYVLLRSLLIPSEAGALWSALQSDLGDTLASLIVFGIAWAYHARVVSHEAGAAQELDRQATIRWIYGYIVALVGVVTFSIGLGGTLGTVLDLLANPGLTRSEHWWEERLSLFATMIVVGLPIWLIPWHRLQREVVASVARRSLARRIYIYLVLGVAVLTLLGSGAYTLYQILRVALGEQWTVTNTSDLIDAASAAIVAGLMLAYHLRVFQRDSALAREDDAAEPPVPAVPTPLLAPGDGLTLSAGGRELVTLLVVRPPTPGDGEALRERLQAALPPGTLVESITLDADEAARLLGSSSE
ncbi:MAG TPA: DUF5671 domain-containing protein [Chloroflexota bacterium]|nr:DUF5671 domain-containing protein [Chloroflexota bacterium]